MKKLNESKEIKNEVKKIEDQIKEDKRKISGIKEKLKYSSESYKKFEIIYIKYGQEAYCKYVPTKYKNRDKNNLIKQGRYIEIYNKYGEKAFENCESKARRDDVYYETGSLLKAYIDSSKQYAKNTVIPGIMTLAIAMPSMVGVASEIVQQQEEHKYNIEIEEYKDQIEEYGKKISSYNLTDLQNIMKVMDDMWGNIKGYGNPTINLISCSGLDLATEEAVGVCRNMADDMARKLNSINKKYNARLVTVYIDGEEYNFPNIERKKAEQEQEKQEDENQEETNSDFTTKITGNHAVVFMDVPDENVTLVIDPTNPGIGVFQNGRIIMFNSEGEKPLTLTMKPLGASLFGLKPLYGIANDYITSINFKNYEDLNNKFGLDAQNKALNEIRNLDKDWIETIKIDPSKLEQKDQKNQNQTHNNISSDNRKDR